LSWLGRLLPFVEEQPLWALTVTAFAQQPNFPYTLPHYGIMTPVKVYGCPADSRVASPQQTHGGLRVALSSYVGVLGTDFRKNDGVLFGGSHVRLTDITDGTAHTLMVGERPPSPDFWYGWWYAGDGQARTGSGDVVLGVRELHFANAPFTSNCPPGP